MNKPAVVFTLLIVIGLSACAEQETPTDAWTGIELQFQESEPGLEPYPMRVLVTSGYLRMDDGDDAGDFILYDRQTREIYSVAHENDSIFKITHRPVTLPMPETLALDEQTEQDTQAPTIDGTAPMHHRFRANGKVCYEVIAVEGLLEDARLVMIEYVQTLAGEQALNLDKTPPEYREECMLSNLVFAPERHLEAGFPIREWDYKGYERSLIDFKTEVALDPALFQVPADYSSYAINPGTMEEPPVTFRDNANALE